MDIAVNMAAIFCSGERFKQLTPNNDPPTSDTQITLALLQELLMALRANDADGYKSWLPIGIDVKQLHFQLNSDTIDPN